MSRTLLQGLIWLAVGAVVNVVVAWTCAVSVDAFHAAWKQDRASIKDAVWVVTRWSRFGSTVIASYRSRTGSANRSSQHRPVLAHMTGSSRGKPLELVSGWSGLAASTPEFQSRAESVETRYADARGWPMRSMWSETRFFRAGFPMSTGAEQFEPRTTRGGIATPLPRWKDGNGAPVASRVLPLRPIIMGFLFNSIFYGGILLLARRLMNLRRGSRIEPEPEA